MVIENSHNFNTMAKLCNGSDGIVIPIPLDHRSHPSNCNLSGIYILLLNNMQKYYIPINHTESLKLFTLEESNVAIETLSKTYVIDSKAYRHIFGQNKYMTAMLYLTTCLENPYPLKLPQHTNKFIQHIGKEITSTLLCQYLNI